MEDILVVSNWTRWEAYRSPEDEYWWWERIPPEFWHWLKDLLFWLPAASSVVYCIGIQRLHNYMKARSHPVACKPYRVMYNIFVTFVSIYLAYKLFSLMPLPNVFTSEGVYSLLCIRRPMKSAFVTYLSVAIILRMVHFLDTVFVVLDKRRMSGLQMFHHVVALNVSHFLTQYDEPYTLAVFMIICAHHCIAYLLSTVKAFGVKLPKWLSVFMLVTEAGIMLFGCLASLYAAKVIQAGLLCYRHPRSAFVMNFCLSTICLYVIKVFISRFILPSKTKMV